MKKTAKQYEAEAKEYDAWKAQTGTVCFYSEPKTWAGVRCVSCGSLLIKGKCKVNKKDCGRK